MTSPTPSQLQHDIDQAVAFIKETFHRQKKSQAVIAVSGGIDSALSLALVTKALGADNITPLFLPYDGQSTTDSKHIAEFLHIPTRSWREINITPIVMKTVEQLGGDIETLDRVRLGNIMARTRMILVYDTAKALDALVCGTENKSEHYLGYFTRFGDAASDLEPISHFYKTQVRQFVDHLDLPDIFLTKAPSAGLWLDQTDEHEMGFSYEVADQVLAELIDQKKPVADIHIPGVDQLIVRRVADQVENMSFKLKVPYTQ